MANPLAALPIIGPASWWKFWSSGVLAADEAWVIQTLSKVQQQGQVAVGDIKAVMNWTYAHFDVIAQNLAQVIAVANMVGLGANPTVMAAEVAANAILAAIKAAKAASASSTSTSDVAQLAASAQAAYVAVKELQVAHATAAVTVATGAPPKAP